MPTTELTVNKQLDAERRRLVIVQSPVALMMGPLLGLASVLMLWSHSASRWTLVVWLTLLIAIYGFRTVIRHQFLLSTPITNSPLANANSLSIIACLNGCLWGALPWLPLAESALIYTVLIGFVLAGVTATGVTTLAAQRLAAALFIVPCIASLAVRFMFMSDWLGMGFGIMTLMYLGVSLAALKQVSAYLIDNGRLRLRSEADKAALAIRDKELRANEAVLQVVAGSQSQFIQSDNTSALFDKVLNNLLMLTQSEFGLIAEVHRDANGQLFLTALAIGGRSDNSSQTIDRPPFERGMQFHNLNSLLSKTMDSSVAVIENDESQLLHIGLPQSAMPCSCFFGLPLRRGEEVMGLVVLTNRADRYSSTVAEYIDPVIQTLTHILYATHVELQRRESEQITARTRAQLETFIAYTPAAVAMVDTTLRLLAYSDRWRKDFSLPQIDLHDALLYEVLPDTPARWRDCYERALTGETDAEEADPYIGANGHVRWFRWEVRPWYERVGAIGGIVMFYEDVTDTKRAIDTAHARERLLSKLTERVPGMLFQLRFVPNTRQLTLLYASNGAYDIYGKSPDELSDDPDFMFRICHSADKAAVDRSIGNAIKSGSVLHIEHRIVIPEKGERWLLIEASLERLADASYIWHGYAQDITDKKSNEVLLNELSIGPIEGLAS